MIQPSESRCLIRSNASGFVNVRVSEAVDCGREVVRSSFCSPCRSAKVALLSASTKLDDVLYAAIMKWALRFECSVISSMYAQ